MSELECKCWQDDATVPFVGNQVYINGQPVEFSPLGNLGLAPEYQILGKLDEIIQLLREIRDA